MFEIKRFIPIKINNKKILKFHLKIVAESEDCLKTRSYLFILPGGPGANHAHYTDYEKLAESVNLIFYDPRGCGLSDEDAPENYTMDNYIDDLDKIRQALGFSEILLLGKSYGAMCAIHYVLRYPAAVKKLILAAGSATHKFLTTAEEIVNKIGNDEQKEAFITLRKGAFRSVKELNSYFQIMHSLYSVKARTDLYKNPEKKIYYPFNYQALNQGFKTFLRSFNFEPDLKSINCPTLILAGADDWITAPIHAQNIAHQIPGAKLCIFSQAGHSLEADVPDLYFNKISQFINSQCKLDKNLAPLESIQEECEEEELIGRLRKL